MGDISYTCGKIKYLPSIRSSSSWAMILCVNTSFLSPIPFTVMTICSSIITENVKCKFPMIREVPTGHFTNSFYFYKLMFARVQWAVAIFE